MLNPRQLRFCQEYIIDLNGTQAAIRAGYKGKTAVVHACKLLMKANIQDEITKLQDKRSKKTEITAEKVLRELAKIGFADVKNYVKWGAEYELKESDNLTDEQSAAVSEVIVRKTSDGGSIQFKLHDKVAALEKIGRHLGMFNDKLSVDLTINSWDALEKEMRNK